MVEKRNIHFILYPILVLIVIIVIIAIIAIWSPTFFKMKKNTINSYIDLNYEEKITDYYRQYLNNNLKLTNFDELYSKIDSSYINSLGISDKEELKSYLKENSYISMNFKLLNFEIHQLESNNYIIVSYSIKNTTKYVTITESRPYEFKISFMDSYNLSNSVYDFELSGIRDSVEYNFDIIESTNNNIKLKLTITNNSNRTIAYDFSYLDSVQLIYDENTTVNMSSIANSASSKYSLTPGSMTTLEVYYNLPYEKQLSISGARINNATINGTSYSVEI